MPTDSDRSILRADLASLDEDARKVVGGLVAVMIQSPERVKDREWMGEQLTQVLLLAWRDQLEALPDAGSGMEVVHRELAARGEEWTRLAFRVFTATAEDLTPRLADGVTREQALVHAMGFLMEHPGE
jgi:hypothetical protein